MENIAIELLTVTESNNLVLKNYVAQLADQNFNKTLDEFTGQNTLMRFFDGEFDKGDVLNMGNNEAIAFLANQVALHRRSIKEITEREIVKFHTVIVGAYEDRIGEI